MYGKNLTDNEVFYQNDSPVLSIPQANKQS